MDFDIPSWVVFTIGFLAQLFFTARTLIQWLCSEKSRHNESPSGYWIFSVLGSWTMFFYGVLRNDFAIILGQIISYYVYLWNLGAKGLWKKIVPVVKAVLVVTPLVAILLLMWNGTDFADKFLHNDEVPWGLMIFGSAGQVIFTLRFVYQWLYSRKRHSSELPAGFWVTSLIGSSVIVAYGIFRKDPVLVLGQSFGLVAYIRNLVIGRREIVHGRER
ncbi:MAG: lipid-A-disaccharide synthase N-terminal domain-containing protein [Candidatus Cryptobacteroides sp.]